MTTSPSDLTGADLALAAASAAAAVLPSVEPLIAAGAQPGNEHVTAAFSGAVIGELDGPRPGRIAILVGEELTSALASSPIDIDLGAAVQPALDATAGLLGGHARAARVTELDLVLAEIGAAFTVVPLIGAGIAASVLIQDHLLDGAPSELAAADTFVDSALTENVVGPAEVAGIVSALANGTEPVAAPQTTAPTSNVTPLLRSGIERLHGVDMEVTVELGRTRMTVRDLLALTPGAVLELDRAAGSPADLLVNGQLIARGEVVVVDEDFGLRLTEIIDDSAVG